MIDFSKNTITELGITIVYILIITIILPWLKYIAKTSKLFSVILIYMFGSKLENHDVFKSISMIHKTNIPARIDSIGKKLLFTDILRIESHLMTSRLKEYFRERAMLNEKNRFKRIYKLLSNYKQYERLNISIEITNILDENKALIGGMLIVEIYPFIEIKRHEIIRYIKRNKESLEVEDIEVESIKEVLQIAKARKIVSKYEEMMLLYRNQLSANMLTQFISNKNLYELLIDVLNNSVLPVYLNIRDTIDIPINLLNGELQGIVYKNHPI